MICIPGLTVVDLRAMSVSRLISIPGDTSIESDASPASGRKPWATVPRNAAYCAWRLSRKTYARRSILPMRDLLSRDDLDAGRGPDPGRAGRDHVLHVLRRPDPAGRLDAHLRAARPAQVLGRATDPGRVDADGREAMLLRLRAQLVDLGRGRVRPQQRVVDVAREVARDVVRLAVIRDARGAAGDNVADLRGAARRAGAGAGEAQIAGLHCAGATGATGAERSQHLAGDRLDEVGACVRGLGHRARSSPGDFM